MLSTVRSFTKRKLEGAEPLLHNQFPLPYEGRGIKGVG